MAVLFVGVPQFAVSYAQGWAMSQADPSLMTWASFGGLFATVLTAYILQGALTRAAVDDLSGAGVSFAAAIGDGLRFFFPLLIVGILVGIGIMAGFLLLIVPGIILSIRWIVTAPVVVIERDGPTKSMGRSAELTENNRWAIFGLIVLYLLLVYAVQFGALMIYRALGADPLSVMQNITTNSVWLGFVAASSVLAALITLISTVGVAVIYFELRRVKEGVGVAELAKVFE
jgi:hypothetical protein